MRHDTNDPAAVAAYVKKILDAIDTRDYEGIEGLRTWMGPAHIPGLLATWRASLPWDVKGLYTMLSWTRRTRASSR